MHSIVTLNKYRETDQGTELLKSPCQIENSEICCQNGVSDMQRCGLMMEELFLLSRERKHMPR